jgi:hypothetical protein
MPAAAAIPLITAAVGAGSSIAGGLIGKSAASGASEAQVQAAAEARKYIQDLLDKYNPPIEEAAQKAADLALGGVANAAGGLGKYYADQQTLAKLADLLKNPAVK